MTVLELFSEEVIDRIRQEIVQASGQEIFLTGTIDREMMLITDYNLLARGNHSMVPAILSDLKPGNIMIHNHPSGDLSPSAADIRIASRMGNQGIGFAIINNQVDQVYLVVEPKLPAQEVLLEREEILDLFQPGGKLAAQLNSYEYREQQITVVDQVITSFNQHQHYFIEAGTGTGKSFAYLIPALFFAVRNERVVVVSTNTINLQEQLIEKDLVLLKKILPFNFKAVLVKGRGNYVCKRKLNQLEHQVKELYSDQVEKQLELIRLLNWLEETRCGSRSELDFMVSSDLWEDLASESDLCLRNKCPFFDSCYFMLARKEVHSADLLVVNHHLLLSDALLKVENKGGDNGVLPLYRNLIVDEAHNIDEAATRHLGRPFYYPAVNKYLQRLFHNRFSLLPRLRNLIGQLGPTRPEEIFKMIDNKLIPQVQRLIEFNRAYFNQLKQFVDQQDEDNLRLTTEVIVSAGWSEVRQSGDKLLEQLRKLGFYLSELYEQLITRSNLQLERLEENLLELESVLSKCQYFIGNLEFNLAAEHEQHVFWLEQKRSYINQENAPLEIASLLSEMLWEKLDSLILTSATLTVKNGFDFFKNLLGLEQARTVMVETPFDYSRQTELIIPDDIPPANTAAFLEEITDGLKELLIAFGGRTMVLFTSYSMLNYCRQRMDREMEQNGLKILAQGDYPRSFIINAFRKKTGQIIFGTVSFWEGVDLKGDDLQFLIIMRLPFPAPSEPIAAARIEQLEKEGKNPFINYSLPRAVIRFKQGFGRLIRTKQDRGIVVLLDNRVLNKAYGRVFLQSLPGDCPIKRSSLKSIAKRSEFV